MINTIYCTCRQVSWYIFVISPSSRGQEWSSWDSERSHWLTWECKSIYASTSVTVYCHCGLSYWEIYLYFWEIELERITDWSKSEFLLKTAGVGIKTKQNKKVLNLNVVVLLLCFFCVWGKREKRFFVFKHSNILVTVRKKYF